MPLAVGRPDGVWSLLDQLVRPPQGPFRYDNKGQGHPRVARCARR